MFQDEVVYHNKILFKRNPEVLKILYCNCNKVASNINHILE